MRHTPALSWRNAMTEPGTISNTHAVRSARRRGRIGLGVLFVASALGATVPRGHAQSTAVTFAAAGDHGSGAATTASLRALANSGAAFYLALGDLSYGSTRAEAAWCDLVRSSVGASYPFELVSGNHDAGSNGFIDNFAACLRDRMGARGRYGAEYYFDYGTLLRVIMIAPDLQIGGESYQYVQGGSHYAWLAQRIDEARAGGIPWVIVGMHKVCISVGEKKCEIGVDLMNLLISKRVDLILQGHDHTYQRSKQLTCAFQNSFVSACVADAGSDDVYTKGAGAVFVIAGAFGKSFDAIDTRDPEAGYFARWMGEGANPTYGFVTYTVTPEEISARYVGTSGGTFTDSFRIVSPAKRRRAAPLGRTGRDSTPGPLGRAAGGAMQEGFHSCAKRTAASWDRVSGALD